MAVDAFVVRAQKRQRLTQSVTSEVILTAADVSSARMHTKACPHYCVPTKLHDEASAHLHASHLHPAVGVRTDVLQGTLATVSCRVALSYIAGKHASAYQWSVRAGFAAGLDRYYHKSTLQHGKAMTAMARP